MCLLIEMVVVGWSDRGVVAMVLVWVWGSWDAMRVGGVWTCGGMRV